MSKFKQVLLTWLLVVFVRNEAAPSRNYLKIIGGTPAIPGEFGWIVSIQIRREFGENIHICGGTLVSMSRVVTAAHCVNVADPISSLGIVAGAHYLRDAQNGIQQLRTIKKVAIHPRYSGETSLGHDIAVIELTTPFLENGTVSAIPMATRYQQYSGTCQIAGWGRTETQPILSPELIKGNLTINTQTQCMQAYPGDFNPDFEICAGNMNGEVVDVCDGDTGGPLTCSNTNGSKYFAGVSSWGFMCGGHGKPGVYMAVSKYRTWLDSIVAGDEDQGTSTTSPTTTRTTTRHPYPNPENPSTSTSPTTPKHHDPDESHEGDDDHQNKLNSTEETITSNPHSNAGADAITSTTTSS